MNVNGKYFDEGPAPFFLHVIIFFIPSSDDSSVSSSFILMIVSIISRPIIILPLPERPETIVRMRTVF